jgi:pantoate--beta-alanine ligase
MEVIYTIAGIKDIRHSLKGTVGFFPTLGYMHQGHVSLVERARQENDKVFASIYVNPTQFGPNEDFKKYPRDAKRDLALLEPYTDYVFMPADAEMYPKDYNTWVEVKDITEVMEGAIRPGHFRGVTTIVAKLFNIIDPTKAYFGQKDAQQVAVLQKMVRELNMNVEIVVCPTVREPDGLAMSSRNVYLSPAERKGAPVLYKSLQRAKTMFEAGQKSVAEIRREMTVMISKEPLANIEFISFADNETLKEIHIIKPPVLVSMAVKFGKTRLIDNIVLG